MEPANEAQPPKPAKPEQETKWYVLRAISGKERKVKEYLDKEIQINGWGGSILQVLCPSEKVFKVQGGKKVLREKTLFPGYLMIEALDGKLTDDMIQTIKGVTNVIHFLGKDQPTALRKSEVNKMFGKMDEVDEQGISYADPYIIGETVRITDGPFNDFNGTVEEVNDEKKKLKVVVKIFGRATPVELSYMQVEKIA
ncbi:MAG: transcription termination/antitermination factor NusG [Chitinophagaceae bacterium]|nr:transcription termination/antitermination factor NusG [Chitinophagaceae bacterium]MCB9045876.1 transcription termination/antitermination factor NusG [Chitinophagales bacterium]